MGPDSEFPVLTPSTLLIALLRTTFSFDFPADDEACGGSRRFRPIVSPPWVVGELQAAIIRHLPTKIFTIARDSVRLMPADRFPADTIVFNLQ